MSSKVFVYKKFIIEVTEEYGGYYNIGVYKDNRKTIIYESNSPRGLYEFKTEALRDAKDIVTRHIEDEEDEKANNKH